MQRALTAELWSAVRVAPAATTSQTSAINEELEIPEAARLHMKAVSLSPNGAKAYRDLARALAEHDAHPTTRVAVLAHAEVLNPFDTALQFEHTNARIKELELHLTTPNRSRGEGGEETIHEKRLATLAILRKLSRKEHGRYMPTVYNSLGTILHQMHKREHTSRAALEHVYAHGSYTARTRPTSQHAMER